MADRRKMKASEPMSDEAFNRAKDRLRLELASLQQRCRRKAKAPVMVVIAGIRGAGLLDTFNLLNSWMDPRGIHTHANDTPSDEERERPFFWRYWRRLPEAGTIGLYLGGWYESVICDLARGGADPANIRERLSDITAFERTLADDGASFLKIWLTIETRAQRQQTRRPDPLTGIAASDAPLDDMGSIAAVTRAGRQVMEASDSPRGRWHVVDGRDINRRRATVLALMRDCLRRHLKAKPAAALRSLPGPKRIPDRLAKLKQPDRLSRPDYAKAFFELQCRLLDLQKRRRKHGRATVIVFEGWDASGKGGAIKRLTYALNARDYHVVPITAPTEEERARHYLWRFWRHLPRAGRVAIFDRSWYGRVLVERVDKFIPPAAWRRAYREINELERELAEAGILVLKFWLHITKDEQLRRFKERDRTPHKRWKLTPEDWHNRRRWADYEAAVNEMVARTGAAAPWHIIAANDKRSGRIAILRRIAEAMAADSRR